MWKNPGDITLLYMRTINAIIWCMVSEITSDTVTFVILGYFLPFYPANNLKNQNCEKMKKKPGDIIILHLYTTNDNRMMYGSWDIFLILDNFLPFYPTNNPENQNFEKMKNKPWDIIILHKCTINDNHMMYGSWDMKRDREKFWKNEKNVWRYHTKVY